MKEAKRRRGMKGLWGCDIMFLWTLLCTMKAGPVGRVG